MRVLYFTGAYRPDSMISHTHGDLVAALRARGIALEIATTGPSAPGATATESVDRHGTTVWTLPVHAGRFNRAARIYSARVWAFAPFLGLVHAMRQFFTPERLATFDLIQVGMAYPYATALRHVLKGVRTPQILVTITGGDIVTDTETGYGYGRLRTTRTAIGRTLRWATLVQANSPRTARIVEGYGVPGERVAVQPPQSPHEPLPAADLAAFRAAARARLESTGAIPPGRLLIGLGRMVAIKGYDDVIRALPAIRAVQPTTTVLFAGPARDATAAAYVSSLTRLAAEEGVADAVRILPQIPYDEVPDYFAAADLALIPSLIDGLNKTGIEAGAVGTPSVISETAGLADYVTEYRAGAVIPSRDPAALGAAILRLLSDEREWQTAADGARRMVEGFSLDATADGVHALYRRIAGP